MPGQRLFSSRDNLYAILGTNLGRSMAEEELQAAARAAHCHDFIVSLRSPRRLRSSA